LFNTDPIVTAAKVCQNYFDFDLLSVMIQ